MATFNHARWQQRIGADDSIPTVPSNPDPDTWSATDIAVAEWYFAYNSGLDKYRCWTRDNNGLREVLFSDDIQNLIEGLVDAAVDAIRAGVPSQGDTLNKLYNLITSWHSEVEVANIAARDAYNVVLPLNVFVTDDGDGRWALYRAITAGVGATFVKLSDPDLLNAAVSASTILATALTGLSTSSAETITAADSILSALGKLQAQAIAEATARANADTTLQSNIDAETSARQLANTAISVSILNEAQARAAADAELESQMNLLKKFKRVSIESVTPGESQTVVVITQSVQNIMVIVGGQVLDETDAHDCTYDDNLTITIDRVIEDYEKIIIWGNY